MFFCSCIASARRLRPSVCGASPATLLAVVFGFVSESWRTRQSGVYGFTMNAMYNLLCSQACPRTPNGTAVSKLGSHNIVSSYHIAAPSIEVTYAGEQAGSITYAHLRSSMEERGPSHGRRRVVHRYVGRRRRSRVAVGYATWRHGGQAGCMTEYTRG